MKIIVVITLVILLYLSKWLYNIITSKQGTRTITKKEKNTKKEYYIYWNAKSKNGTLYKTVYNTYENALKELERLRHYHRNYGLNKTVDLWIE